MENKVPPKEAVKTGGTRSFKGSSGTHEDMITGQSGLCGLTSDYSHACHPGPWDLTELWQVLSQEVKHCGPQNNAVTSEETLVMVHGQAESDLMLFIT